MMLFDPNWKETKIDLGSIEQSLLHLGFLLLIEEKGWTRGKLQAGRGYCMVGALQIGVNGTPKNPEDHAKQITRAVERCPHGKEDNNEKV